jgi:hypothetical protein
LRHSRRFQLCYRIYRSKYLNKTGGTEIEIEWTHVVYNVNVKLLDENIDTIKLETEAQLGARIDMAPPSDRTLLRAHLLWNPKVQSHVQMRWVYELKPNLFKMHFRFTLLSRPRSRERSYTSVFQKKKICSSHLSMPSTYPPTFAYSPY